MSPLSRDSERSAVAIQEESPIICLCGSTRFKEVFEQEVMLVGCKLEGQGIKMWQVSVGHGRGKRMSLEYKGKKPMP